MAVILTLRAFRDNVVFFYAPSELAKHSLPSAQLVRVGGLVKEGSIIRGENGQIRFHITDEQSSIAIRYQGMLPGLFRENQGVIAEGYLVDAGHFEATRILTKHDERYMPKDVVDALKKSGRWQEGTSP